MRGAVRLGVHSDKAGEELPHIFFRRRKRGLDAGQQARQLVLTKCAPEIGVLRERFPGERRRKQSIVRIGMQLNEKFLRFGVKCLGQITGARVHEINAAGV